MRLRLLILTAAAVPAISVMAQAPSLPPDINPVTLSRFGPVTPADLDEEGQKILAARTTPPNPGPGPGAAGAYSPKTSEGRGLIGRALGVPSGQNFPLGNRIYQLVVLITARDIDQQYEWSAHEPAGLRAGLEQSVIDVVKFRAARGRPCREGRDAHSILPRAAARAQSVERPLRKDDRDLRQAANRGDDGAGRRLLDGGDDDERGGSASAATRPALMPPLARAR